MKYKRILFITGSRSDFGKIKGLIRAVDDDDDYEAFVYVSGMHLVETFGNTYKEVLAERFSNTYVDYSQVNTNISSIDCGNTIINLSSYVNKILPDMIIVHGDRIDALSGAIVGALNNICVAHIEGGEVSGTIDDSIRHAVSKLSSFHFVSNTIAKNRLIQLGEPENRIFVIGSPDIDIMLSLNNISVADIKEKYNISFNKYAILLYHPVTTEVELIPEHIHIILEAIEQSKYNYLIIYPNNDLGYEFIVNEIKNHSNSNRFRVFQSLPFEVFITLLKNAEFLIGNSSAGIRETGVFGVPSIDIGTRQNLRDKGFNNSNIQHVSENLEEIRHAIANVDNYRRECFHFGKGDSISRFMSVLKSDKILLESLQKTFNDFQ